MPDTGFLGLSVLCLAIGAMCILFPRSMLELSRALNRTIMTLDERLMRHRHILGFVLFALSYGLFQLALLVPHLRR